jgi:glycine cleavage system transcriptional repressor
VAHFAVSAVGRDRPGIVAAITGSLLELDGNVEDSRMTILRGQFAVMLIVSLPDADGKAELERLLAPVSAELGLDALTVSPVAESASVAVSPDHVITVYGADHPGIVHSVSAALAGHGVNITDLQTKLTGSGPSPLYVMMLEVEIGEAAPAALERALAEVGESADVEIAIRELDSEAL